MYGKTLKSVLGIALLTCGLAAAANAQDNISPEKKALIREMIAATDLQQTVDAMTKVMSAQFEKEEPERIAERVSDIKGLTPQEREKMVRDMTENSARLRKRYEELAQQKLNLPQLMEQIIVSIFDKYFTEEDLKGLIAFYKSPAGVKMLRVMPQLMVDVMTKSNEVIRPKIEEIFEQIRAEEEKRSQSETGKQGRKN